jgi:hypothetical protein
MENFFPFLLDLWAAGICFIFVACAIRFVWSSSNGESLFRNTAKGWRNQGYHEHAQRLDKKADVYSKKVVLYFWLLIIAGLSLLIVSLATHVWQYLTS